MTSRKGHSREIQCPYDAKDFLNPELQRSFGQLGPGLNWSRPASRYLLSLADPFADVGQVGAPVGAAAPSVKNRAFARVRMYVGPDGCGIAMASALGGMTHANNALAVSNASFAGTDAFPVATATNMVGHTTNAIYGDDKHHFGRIVSAGLRVEYTGEVVKRGGLCLSVLQPQGGSLDTTTFDDNAKFLWRTTSIHSVTNEPCYFSTLWSPTMPLVPTQATAAEQIKVVNAGGAMIALDLVDSYANFNMGIMITGAEPGSSFWVEFVGNYEYFGNTSQPSLSDQDSSITQAFATPSYTDPEADEVARSSAGIAPNAMPKNTNGALTKAAQSAQVANAAQDNSSLISRAGAFLKDIGADGMAWQLGQKALQYGAKSLMGQNASAMKSIGSTVKVTPLLEESELGASTAEEMLPIIEEIGEVAPLLLM